jgi:hypothetical protein
MIGDSATVALIRQGHVNGEAYTPMVSIQERVFASTHPAKGQTLGKAE